MPQPADKASPYSAAITELKAEGKCLPDTVHRQVKYLNNIIEADHGKLKRLINPVLGFKSMKTAYATNQAPRRKQRGVNCALIIRWLSASLRPKGRGIKPAEIKGFELMEMFKKEQLDIWKSGQGLTGEIRLVERQFGIYSA